MQQYVDDSPLFMSVDMIWLSLIPKNDKQETLPEVAQTTEGTSSLHPPPPPMDRSYKGNRESLYMRLLLVLAAIYDSTGSSDVGRGAEGELAVSSEAIQRLITLKPPPPFFFSFYCH